MDTYLEKYIKIDYMEEVHTNNGVTHIHLKYGMIAGFIDKKTIIVLDNGNSIDHFRIKRYFNYYMNEMVSYKQFDKERSIKLLEKLNVV